jgi:hypothetical protein
MDSTVARPASECCFKPFTSFFTAPMKNYVPEEFAIRALRECLVEKVKRENPDDAANYWRQQVQQHPYSNPSVECFIVLLVNTRRRFIDHHLVSIGSLIPFTFIRAKCSALQSSESLPPFS